MGKSFTGIFSISRTVEKQAKNQHSFQYPLEGYKGLGSYFEFLISKHSPVFLFFVTGFQE